MANSTRPGQQGNQAITNALIVAVALLWGTSLLIQKGRLTWPPYELLASFSTLAGCLALAGPLILARTGQTDGTLGHLMWLVGGLLLWIVNLEGVLQGEWRNLHWATPLPDRTLGLTTLAVLIAGWKCGLTHWNWSWTNVTGWILGTFWVAMACGSWLLAPVWRAGLQAR
jgi:hypothetical protein